MLRGLYDWTMRLAEGRHAMRALGAVSFIESSVFPIPPDVLMIPMVMARPCRAWKIAAVATAFSVLGGVLGYLIGMFAYESIGEPVLRSLGKADAMAAFNDQFNGVGFWAVLAAGVTPFPYKVITIMSGWTAMPLTTFILTSVVARALRFFVVAGLLRTFGPPIREFVERRLALAFTAFVVVLFAGFAAIGYL